MIPFLHIGIAFSLLSIIFFLSKRPLRISDKIALTFLVFLAIPMLFKLRIVDNFRVNLPNGILSTKSFPFLFTYGPLLYLYIKFQTVSIPAFKKQYLLHFLPFILFAAISFIAAELNPPQPYTAFESHPDFHEPGQPPFFNNSLRPPLGMSPMNPDFFFPRFDSLLNTADCLFFILLYLSFVFYTFLILRLFYKRKELGPYSKLDYVLLRILVLFFVLSNSFVLFLFFTPESWRNPVFNGKIIPEISTMCFVFVFCSISFKLSNIVDNKTDADRNNNRKYRKSGLKIETANKIIADLEKYMIEEKPYLDSDLTIDDVSQRLGIPRYYLTQVINENLYKNFSTYINEYRIEEAKHMLSDLDRGNKYFTVIDIAYEAGFNSKSMFNLVFKRITGITPSQFKKQKHSSYRSLEKEIIKNEISHPLYGEE